jgi:hypothetical protein
MSAPTLLWEKFTALTCKSYKKDRGAQPFCNKWRACEAAHFLLFPLNTRPQL